MQPIDADALKEAFGERPLNWNDTPEEIQSINDWDNAMTLIDAAPTITISDKWISVKNEKPKKNGLYIVADREFVYSAKYEKGRKVSEWTDNYEEYLDLDVTHWMPLPDLPKGEA